jgi:hypothetical protein
MCSVVVQHQLIGGKLSKYASIRSLVAVNSVQTHAMAKILQVPGVTLPKMCILVGMPDWPTTVFTGVLQVSGCIGGASPITSGFIGGASPITSGFIGGASPITSGFVGGASPFTSGFVGGASPFTSGFPAPSV